MKRNAAHTHFHASEKLCRDLQDFEDAGHVSSGDLGEGGAAGVGRGIALRSVFKVNFVTGIPVTICGVAEGRDLPLVTSVL